MTSGLESEGTSKVPRTARAASGHAMKIAGRIVVEDLLQLGDGGPCLVVACRDAQAIERAVRSRVTGVEEPAARVPEGVSPGE